MADTATSTTTKPPVVFVRRSARQIKALRAAILEICEKEHPQTLNNIWYELTKRTDLTPPVDRSRKQYHNLRFHVRTMLKTGQLPAAWFRRERVNDKPMKGTPGGHGRKVVTVFSDPDAPRPRTGRPKKKRQGGSAPDSATFQGGTVITGTPGNVVTGADGLNASLPAGMKASALERRAAFAWYHGLAAGLVVGAALGYLLATIL